MGFLDKNIDGRGRAIRGAIGALMLIIAIVIFFATELWWLAVIFLISAVFGFVEAARGWCALKACKIKVPF